MIALKRRAVLVSVIRLLIAFSMFASFSVAYCSSIAFKKQGLITNKRLEINTSLFAFREARMMVKMNCHCFLSLKLEYLAKLKFQRAGFSFFLQEYYLMPPV